VPQNSIRLLNTTCARQIRLFDEREGPPDQTEVIATSYSADPGAGPPP
jgi:hypothetical protein